jgi:hypothetical protein
MRKHRTRNLEIPRCAIAHLRSGAGAPSRNDCNYKRTFAFPRRVSPGVCCLLRVLSNQRAQGRPGARCTRGLACKVVQRNAHEHTGSAEAVRPSLRNGFNGFLRALPGDRALLPPSFAKVAFRELDASVGASGPHDFAVRIRAVRPTALPASTASSSRVDDVGQRPSVGKDARTSAPDLPDGTSGIFLRMGLDRGGGKLPDWANQ